MNRIVYSLSLSSGTRSVYFYTDLTFDPHPLAAHDEQLTITIPDDRESRLESEKSYKEYNIYIYYIQDVCIQVEIIPIIGS